MKSGEGIVDGAAKTERTSAPGRVVRIQVLSGGKNKVNVAVPLAVARMGKWRMGANGNGHLAKFGVDLDALLRTVDRSGPLVDVADTEDRLLIVIE